MDPATMLDFGPEHEDHYRVLWEADLEQIVIQLPAWIIHLLTHNDPPTVEQRKEVADLQKQLQSAFEEPQPQSIGSSLRNSESEVILDDLRLQKLNTVCDIIQSPIRCLQNDILYQIFLHFHPKTLYCPSSRGLWRAPCYLPAPLFQVSKSWNSIAKATPALWQEVHLLCLPKGRHDPRQIQYIKRFSDHSGALPLSFQVEKGHNVQSQTFCDLVHWLLSGWEGRTRLTRLGLRCYRMDAVLDKLLESNIPSPEIKSLLIVVATRRGTGPTGGVLTRALSVFPQLTHLWMEDDERNSTLNDMFQLPTSCLLPWSKLTTLFLSHIIALDGLHFLLQICPNLTDAWFNCYGKAYPPGSSPVNITHHRLDRLIITFSRTFRNFDLLSFLRGLKFPSLQTLHIRSHEGIRYQGYIPSTDIFPLLKRLTIEFILLVVLPESIAGICPIFPAVPETTTLAVTMDRSHLYEFVMFFQYHADRGRHLLPHLRSLHITLYTDRSQREFNETTLTQAFVGISELWGDLPFGSIQIKFVLTQSQELNDFHCRILGVCQDLRLKWTTATWGNEMFDGTHCGLEDSFREGFPI